MRTLRYILTGRPHNLDDWLDRLRKTRGPARVRVRPVADESVTEMFVRKDLICEFLWELPGSPCCCKDWCGGFFVDAPEFQRAGQLRRANARLERRIEELREAGAEVLDAARRVSPALRAAKTSLTWARGSSASIRGYRTPRGAPMPAA